MNLPVKRNAAPVLPDLWEAEEEAETQGSFDLRRAVMISVGLFLILLLIAAFVPMGAAVIGMGAVGVESRVKRIAHPTGGVIAEILVANGEHVNRGDLLLRLDDKVTGADAVYSSLTVEQLLAERARLEAERLGASAIRWPAELSAAQTDSARKAMADSQRLFTERRNEEVQLRGQLSARVSQYNQEIVGLQAQIVSLQRQRTLIEPERAAVKELWDKQLVTINRMNQLERTAADLEGNTAALQAQIAQTRARISEISQQSIQLGDTRRVQAGTELAQVNTALNQQRLRAVAATDQQDRSEIRAPYSGTVEKIAFAAIGDVIRPAEPIMEIVPDQDEKVVEVAVSPEDVDQVRTGQTAYIRFTSYNRASTPELRGKVIYVATDRSDNTESKQSYYTVRVAIDQADLKAQKLDLRSGMPAETHIETGSRSLLSYMFKPLRDQFARAFSDN